MIHHLYPRITRNHLKYVHIYVYIYLVEVVKWRKKWFKIKVVLLPWNIFALSTTGVRIDEASIIIPLLEIFCSFYNFAISHLVVILVIKYLTSKIGRSSYCMLSTISYLYWRRVYGLFSNVYFFYPQVVIRHTYIYPLLDLNFHSLVTTIMRRWLERSEITQVPYETKQALRKTISTTAGSRSVQVVSLL